MVDSFRLTVPQLLLEVTSDEAIPEGIDGSFGRNIFRRIAEADPL
jgi:hypothetical protein